MRDSGSNRRLAIRSDENNNRHGAQARQRISVRVLAPPMRYCRANETVVKSIEMCLISIFAFSQVVKNSVQSGKQKCNEMKNIEKQ